MVLLRGQIGATVSVSSHVKTTVTRSFGLVVESSSHIINTVS